MASGYNPFAAPAPAQGAAPAPSGGGGGAYNPFAVPAAAPGAPAAAAPQQGGIMGSIMGAVHTLMQPVHEAAHFLNGTGYVGQQVVKASDLIAHTPGGIYQGLNVLGNDILDPNAWVHPLTFKDPQQKALKAQGVQQKNAVVQTIEHPARNLLQTALTVLPVAGGLARVGLATADAAAAEGGIAAKAGTFAKSIAKPEIPARTLSVPRLESPDGEGPAALKTTAVQLVGSKGSLGRVLQKGHDVVVQNALNKIPQGGGGRIASYGAHRVAMSIEEGARIQGAVQGTLASQLERSAKDSTLSKDEGSLTHFLAANQVTPEEMAAYARDQAGKVGQKTVGIKTFDEAGMPHVHGAGETITPTDAARLSHVAALAESLAQKGVLDTAAGKVTVNADQFPQTAASYERLKAAQGIREQIVTEHGLVNPETAAARKDLVGQKIGTNRPGEVFTTLKTRQPIPPKGSFARVAGKIIPRAKRLNAGPLATGSGLERGMVPSNTAGETAAGLRAAQRFQNTTDLRGTLANLGSDVRASTNDVLVAKAAGQGKFKAALPDDVKVLMGKLTDNTISPEEEQALHGKFQSFVSDHLLNHNPEQAVGQRAPEGWTFVHKNLVPDALSGATPTGGIGKFADTLNSAITSATVYTKLGHLPQRLFTNATANLVQTMNPLELGKSVVMARNLPDELKSQLEAATGGHASMAPLAGVTTINPAVRFGRFMAGGWARHIDAPFRLNSILYELRQSGIKTPEQIRAAMNAIKDPTRSGMSGSQIMKVDGAVRRSNRAAMMYDGMSNAEKARVAKYMWFYPWTKAAVRFTGHTASEHPIKAAGLGQAGVAGTAQAKKTLGVYPSYENNLTPLTGGKFPLVSDLGALSPYDTTANMLNVLKDPLNADNGLPTLANPSLAGVENVIKGKGLKSLLEGIVSPTPEYQVGSAIAHPKGSGFFPTSSKNLFGATPQSALLRALTGGTATPRKVNKSKLNEYAARQGMKAKTFTVYSK